MRIDVFTEGSNTTAQKDSVDFVRDFFLGQFRQVKRLTGILEDYGDVTVHILSEEYGYLTAGDPISNLSLETSRESAHIFSEKLGRSAEVADVIVVLLTRSVFEDIVADQWNELVSNSNQDSIWFFGVSQSAISSVDLDRLHSNSDHVDVYERVGVARINSESRDVLVGRIKQKQNMG